MDHDDDNGRRRFMVNAISKHALTMYEEVDVPIICLDDDDDDDDDDYLKSDKNYKMFLDHIIDDNSIGPLFELNSSGLDRPIRYEVDNGGSETRKFEMFSGESKRSEVKNENPVNNNRVSQQRKRKTVGFKAEISRARESIQRDNRAAERRKKRIGLLVGEQDNIQRDKKMSKSKVESSRDVPLVIAQESIQRDNRVRNLADIKVETLGRRAVPLVRGHEDIRRDHKDSAGKKKRLSELEPETLRRAVPLVRAEQDIHRDNNVKVNTLSHLPLVRDREDVQRDHKVCEGRKRRLSELESEALRSDVPLFRAEEDVQRDNNVIAERRKRETVETMAAGNSKAVTETSRIVQVTQRNKGNFVGRRKKNEEEKSVAVVEKGYMSYLTWLVDSLKDLTTTHVANLQNDPSDFDPPVLAALEESTVAVPVKDTLVNVKVEQDLESWSDDSDIIAVSDSPFWDGEDTPFVVSKSVVDLDNESKEDESRSCLFTKELMDVLKKPYDEQELLELSNQASMQKPVTRCREFRKGREKIYKTDKLGPSYLQRFSDFDKEYKLVDGVDKAKALKLLRGFFFYLRNCSRPGAFKPWSKDI